MRTVIVLGAGFTKAFFPDSPLMVGDFENDELEHQFQQFPTALRLLQLERARCPNQSIDIERLMTRLQGGMPYDASTEDQQQIGLLLTALKKRFLAQLQTATRSQSVPPVWLELAGACLQRKIHAITFNYDDAFDAGLMIASRRVQGAEASTLQWSPVHDYGFHLPPARSLAFGALTSGGSSGVYLLKLHGSLNWFPVRGAPTPYAVNSIVHQTPRLNEGGSDVPSMEAANLIETEPLIVPPVLLKTAVTAEPILRVVWSRAYEILRSSERVIFVGYSLPVTDIAAKTLFTETIGAGASARIEVASWAGADDAEGRQRLIGSYRSVFPCLSENRFRFDGAQEWARDFIAEGT